MISKYLSKSKSEPEYRGMKMLYTPPVAPTDSSVSASSSDWTSPEDQKVVQAITLRGRIRRNKVSVSGLALLVQNKGTAASVVFSLVHLQKPLLPERVISTPSNKMRNLKSKWRISTL